MKMIRILLVLAMAPIAALAQEKQEQKDSTTNKRENEFSASINYQSALHFFGRVDSLKSQGVFPILGYQFKNGLYAEGAAVFVQNPLQPLDYTGTSVEVGYRFPDKKHFEGNVFFSKFFYEDQSTLVQSALQAQTGVNLSYKNKYVNVNGGADLKFSDKTDVGATLGVDHLFVKRLSGLKKAVIAVMPSANLYAGTQHFTNTYIKRENFLGIPMTRERTEQVARFNIMAYEFSAPVVLVVGKFTAYVSPAYVIPQNLQPGEHGENLFYLAAGVGVKL